MKVQFINIFINIFENTSKQDNNGLKKRRLTGIIKAEMKLVLRCNIFKRKKYNSL